jgi:putative OPT family oligopeptide transporter
MSNSRTSASASHLNELTFRGLLLGALLTIVFTAANVYFGLRAGLTFASSIPAAVISMAVLRSFKDATILENNIVQTVASAAGTLSSIIFVLPGLVMIGWWSGFPFITSFAICALGGTLGVMYSIPLRRSLVVDSGLPFPEGVACAEILKVGASAREGTQEAAGTGRTALVAMIMGTLVSAGFSAIAATRLFATNITHYFRAGTSATGFDLGLSFGLFGVGHLIGLWVGMAMLAGLVIAWGVAVPILTALSPAAGPAADVALATWSRDVRFIGAGAIGVAAIWTLFTLARPTFNGLRAAILASRQRRNGGVGAVPDVDRDLPVAQVVFISLLSLIPIGLVLFHFAEQAGLGRIGMPLVLTSLIFIVVMGMFVSVVCGYMAGLVGSSNSPLSGVGILSAIGAALLLSLIVPSGPAGTTPLVAFALIVTAFVFAISTIANDNLQDLKTGQLVGATPWKQQVALLVGVLAGAAVIPPILDLLQQAYGFAGTPGVDPARALPAPQAALISALAQGVLEQQLNWGLIGIGALVGVAAILLDLVLATARLPRLAPLAIGLGIYLPMSATLMVVIGAVVGFLYDRRTNETGRRLGTLLSCGLIVGESLMGLALAAVVVGSGVPTPLALVGDNFSAAATVLGGLTFAATLFFLYRWLARLARRAGQGAVSN